MLIKFGFGMLHMGLPDPFSYPYDASVTLYLWPRQDVPASEVPWRYFARLCWNWLPDRIYKSLRPTVLLPLTEGELLRSTISGREPARVEIEDHRGADSSEWTGRDHKFIGFGPWRWSRYVYRATRRSLMHVYLTGAKERKQPSYSFSVCPGHSGLMKEEEVPSDWRTADGKEFKEFTLEFKHGRAEVPDQLGEWMIKHGMVQRTNLVRATGKSLLGSLAATIRGQ